MVAPHPKIAWQMNKSVEQIAFVNEACVAYFTRTDLMESERQLLKDALTHLIETGFNSLVPASVDAWLETVRRCA